MGGKGRLPPLNAGEYALMLLFLFPLHQMLEFVHLCTVDIDIFFTKSFSEHVSIIVQ